MVDDEPADDFADRDVTTVTGSILSAVADREGVEEHELREPLYRVIDPDALETLFRDGTGRVTFEYLGYVVTVDHTRQVEVRAASSD